MTFEEMAWEFTEVFNDLDVDQTNEMLAKNVPMATLEFFAKYADRFGHAEGVPADTVRQMPNLMVIGYLLRILEERLPVDEPA